MGSPGAQWGQKTQQREEKTPLHSHHLAHRQHHMLRHLPSLLTDWHLKTANQVPSICILGSHAEVGTQMPRETAPKHLGWDDHLAQILAVQSWIQGSGLVSDSPRSPGWIETWRSGMPPSGLLACNERNLGSLALPSFPTRSLLCRMKWLQTLYWRETSCSSRQIPSINLHCVFDRLP